MLAELKRLKGIVLNGAKENKQLRGQLQRAQHEQHRALAKVHKHKDPPPAAAAGVCVDSLSHLCN